MRHSGCTTSHGGNLMPMNLVQHRGEPSVWDRVDHREWDTERWLIAVAAGALFITALRTRHISGLALALGGAGLAWWAASDRDQRLQLRATIGSRLPLPTR